MSKKRTPPLSDAFLDEIANEINHLYGELQKVEKTDQKDKKK